MGAPHSLVLQACAKHVGGPHLLALRAQMQSIREHTISLFSMQVQSVGASYLLVLHAQMQSIEEQPVCLYSMQVLSMAAPNSHVHIAARLQVQDLPYKLKLCMYASMHIPLPRFPHALISPLMGASIPWTMLWSQLVACRVCQHACILALIPPCPKNIDFKPAHSWIAQVLLSSAHTFLACPWYRLITTPSQASAPGIVWSPPHAPTDV